MTRHLIEFHITFRPTHVATSRWKATIVIFLGVVVVVVCLVVEVLLVVVVVVCPRY